MESFPQRVCYVMVEIPTHISKSPRYLSLYFHRSTKTREYPQVLQPFTAQLFSAQLVSGGSERLVRKLKGGVEL